MENNERDQHRHKVALRHSGQNNGTHFYYQARLMDFEHSIGSLLIQKSTQRARPHHPCMADLPRRLSQVLGWQKPSREGIC